MEKAYEFYGPIGRAEIVREAERSAIQRSRTAQSIIEGSATRYDVAQAAAVLRQEIDGLGSIPLTSGGRSTSSHSPIPVAHSIGGNSL